MHRLLRVSFVITVISFTSLGSSVGVAEILTVARAFHLDWVIGIVSAFIEKLLTTNIL